MREARVEAALVRGVKSLGGEVRKMAWPGRRHAPDRLVLWGAGIAEFIELKAPGKAARPGQAREHARLRRAGFSVYVLDTLEKVGNYLAAKGGRTCS